MSNRQSVSAPNVHNAAVMVDGGMVSAEAKRVIMAIREYEPTLDVRWIPPAARKEGDAAYAIIHDAPGNSPYIMFYVKNDEDMNMSVLSKIIYNDQRNGEDQWSDETALAEANKRMDHQIFLDHVEEMNDIAQHVLRSPLNDYKVNEDLRIKSGVPYNVAHRD